MKKILNFINNEYREPISGEWMDNVNPATGEVYSQLANSSAKDVEAAVEAASDAFPVWSEYSVNKRSRILHKIADLIEDKLEDLAMAESIDNGKPLSLAKAVDIPRAAANFRFFANTIVGYDSRSHDMGKLAINYTIRQPLGVVGCISPWNLPLYLFSWKIAPALATGNTVVAKPSEITPMTASLLGKLTADAGMPPGTLNIIHGSGNTAGEPIVKHHKIKAISFTGGTKTGSAIASIAAPKFKKTSLELGGKNPNIIFADCDFDDMLHTTVNSSFANQGQICLCGSRILVEEKLYDKFLQQFIEKTKQMTVGDPLEKGTRIGAIVSESHCNKILSYIKLAEEEGGTIETGGRKVYLDGRCESGYFIEPTIITGLDQNARCNREEIFGPVVTVMPFTTENEAVELANSVEYGLSATIWTSDLNRSQRLARKIEAGIIWINTWLLRDLRTPFGGMKNSGMGREGGRNALDFFTEQKNVCIKIS